jgi:hypothetical protein
MQQSPTNGFDYTVRLLLPKAADSRQAERQAGCRFFERKLRFSPPFYIAQTPIGRKAGRKSRQAGRKRGREKPG